MWPAFVASSVCLLLNRLSCTHAASVVRLIALKTVLAMYRTLMDSRALRSGARAARAMRPARVVGLACLSMRRRVNGNGSCSASASANLSKFLAIMVGPSCGYLLPFLPPGRGQGRASSPPLSVQYVRNRASAAARPGNKAPPANPLARGSGVSWGWLRVADGRVGLVSRCPARTSARDMTGSACGFWRGSCVRAGSMRHRLHVSRVLAADPGPAGLVRPGMRSRRGGRSPP